MSIVEIIKAIADNGIMLVICAIFLYTVIKFINLGFDKLSAVSRNKQHDRLLELRAQVDEEVYERISKFLTDHNGIRLVVAEFTNSVTSVAYLPFKYMSGTYEVTAYGTKPQSTKVDKLSTSLFSTFLTQLARAGTMLVTDEVALAASGTVHDIFERYECQNQLCAILKTPSGKAIGFVAFGTDKPVTDKDTQDIKHLATELSALLGVVDK